MGGSSCFKENVTIFRENPNWKWKGKKVQNAARMTFGFMDQEKGIFLKERGRGRKKKWCVKEEELQDEAVPKEAKKGKKGGEVGGKGGEKRRKNWIQEDGGKDRTRPILAWKMEKEL